jgi:single-strand DNA-binding protein
MAWDINRVVLIGNLTRDVELRYTSNGTPVAKLGIAVGGMQKDSVSFFNVVVWNKQAENCSKYLSRGKRVAIDGRLEQRTWEAQDGTKRSSVEIIADRVEFLSSMSQSSNDTGSGSREGSYSNDQPASRQEKDEDEGWHDITDFNDEPLSDDDVPEF